MTLPAGTIDLGELPRGGPAEVAAPWPVLARLARRSDRRRAIRLGAAAAVTALALLTLTAAAGPVRPVFTPVLTLQHSGYALDREHLYVVEAPGSDTADATLVAYRLVDGTVRWSVPAIGTAELQLHEGVLLATSELADQRVSTAYDARTGRRLWQRDLGFGFVTPLADGYYLFQEERLNGEQTEDRLTAVDPVTGEPMWTGSVSGRSYHLAATHLVVLDQDRLTSYRLATGERSATVTLPHGPSSDLQVTGGLAVVVDRWDRTPVLTGYDLATLRPQWTVADLAGPEVSVGPDQCGRLVCLSGPHPRVIDRTTGETVWSADWLPAGADDDSWYWVTDPELPGLAGRLLLFDVAGRRSGEPGHWLVDVGTGEPVLDLAGWQLGPGWGPTATGSATPLLVRFVDQAALVGRLRPDLSGVMVLGAIDAAPPSWCWGLVEQVLCVAPAAGDRQPSELVLWGRR